VDVTFGDMQVCVAYPTGGDPQPYLHGGRVRNGKILQGKRKLLSGKGFVGAFDCAWQGQVYALEMRS
jgi:hypothetical protein